MPETVNPIANALTSLACGIQVETFRKIHDNSITTTMCIGNLRSGTYYMDQYLSYHDKAHFKKAILYYGIIITFILGAVIESKLILMYGSYAIMFSVVMLLLAFMIMSVDLNKEV